MKLSVPVCALGALALFLTSAFVSSLSSCSRRAMPPSQSEQWVAAYTPAHIDQDSKIRLELTDLMRAAIDTTRLLEGVFDFSPALTGKALYSADKRYIDFVPEHNFEPGRKYECRVNMKALTGVDSLGDFAFGFHVDRREIRFSGIGVSIDRTDPECLAVKGRLEFSSAAGCACADSSLIACDYPGSKVKVESAAEKGVMNFTVSGIRRRDGDTELTLAVNPKGGFWAKECKVRVPSSAGFVLLDAEMVDAVEPYINLEFSSPLSPTQDLDGLISMDNISELRFERSGAAVKVFYPANAQPRMVLRVSEMVKSAAGAALEQDIVRHFTQEAIAPAIKLPFDGHILPDSRCLRLPFKAVNLAAVDVEVVRIFPANVMAFLQENELNETSQLRRFGRLVYRHTVRLDTDSTLDLHQWQNFSIDLENMFARQRGAIYNIRLTFRKAYSLYGRSKAEPFEECHGVSPRDEEEWDEDYPYVYRDAPDRDWFKFNWHEKDDPSTDSYYMEDEGRMPEVNLVASGLGLIVKRGKDNNYRAVVNDINTAAPAAGVRVTAFNYQLQSMGSAVTGEGGFADLETAGTPFMITATDGHSTTYLKVTQGSDLSTSNFDVEGMSTQSGIKGFAYGDRGVWRPGDEIHLSFIVEDRNESLPANHPVVMELYNPDEQLYNRQVCTAGVDGFYVFHTSTDEKAPTGLWKALFKVGDERICLPVRVETIKPNRLKIDIHSPSLLQVPHEQAMGLTARWLTGPAAKGVAASLNMALYTNPKPFKGYEKYTFANPLVHFSGSQTELIAGLTDSLGSVLHTCGMPSGENCPGMMVANLTAKVTEPGGDASISAVSVPFSPFGVYVGIDLGKREFETDQDIRFPVVVLNQVGARMKTRELEYKIYREDWDWWWEGGRNARRRFVESKTAECISSGTVTATNGMANVPFKIEYPQWGRYLVLVRDTKGGHATGGTVEVDWPQWRGRSKKGGASGSTELTFALDKSEYHVGETANVYLPKCSGGRVLLSVENGSGVVRQHWVELSGEAETKFELKIDKSLTPNFYVAATLLRPHGQTDFNTPIRLFGVRGAKVVDRNSVLHPTIDMPAELHPQQKFALKVSESSGKPMTYTVALVDEGLLDITGFKTPRPWEAMNVKEALGVRTWDMYDDVIGAFGADFKSIFKVGGDEALRRAAGKEKRFNPAVMFLGPFTLKGGSNTHTLTLPNYVGSVRVMVVAAHAGTYGSADRTVKVTSPLMILPTVPRKLANCDTVTVPVNVFALEQGMKNVTVRIETKGPLKALGAVARKVQFDGKGEQLLSFRLACNALREGKGRIIFTAAGGGKVVKDTTYVDISNPMPEVFANQEKTVPAGGSASFAWTPTEKEEVKLQVSGMPMLDFAGVSLFMDSYPHLCTEQLSSKALFMLYGRKFLDADKAEKCNRELPGLIKAILLRQTAGGGFVYWPGQVEAVEWVSSLAGVALSEATRQGFRTDGSWLEKWNAYQLSRANEYKHSAETDLNQAFRLYSMALASTAPAAAMNRLREQAGISQRAAFCLAAAYAEAGRKDVAMALVNRASAIAPVATRNGGILDSRLCSMILEMEAYTLCGMSSRALALSRKLARDCSPSRYVTLDLALTTLALNHLERTVGHGSSSIRIAQDGKAPVSIEGFDQIQNLDLEPATGSVSVENLSSDHSIELSLMTCHRPAPSTIVAATENGLRVTVAYVDSDNNTIDIARLKQDTEFTACISVENMREDVSDMALTYAIPSGWEIWNERMYQMPEGGIDNCDIRDDSVSFYFGLRRGMSQSFKIKLRAVYPGAYTLPPTVCEDMYNPQMRGTTANRRVAVVQ